MKKLEEVIDITSFPEDRHQIKSIKCRLCGDALYEFAKSTPSGEFNSVLSRVKLHLELNHDLVIHWKMCHDKSCVVNHYL